MSVLSIHLKNVTKEKKGLNNRSVNQGISLVIYKNNKVIFFKCCLEIELK